MRKARHRNALFIKNDTDIAEPINELYSEKIIDFIVEAFFKDNSNYKLELNFNLDDFIIISRDVQNIVIESSYCDVETCSTVSELFIILSHYYEDISAEILYYAD